MARWLVSLGLSVLAIAFVACADEDLRDTSRSSEVALVAVRWPEASALGPSLEAISNDVGAEALLVEWASGRETAELRAVGGTALRDLEIGDWDTSGASLSPDGRHAAFVALEPSSRVTEALRVVEVASGHLVGRWESPSPYGAVWSPDSERLYMFEDICAALGDQGMCVSGWQHGLRSMDLVGGGSSVVGSYDFWLSQAAVSSDGAALYGLGSRTEACCGIEVQGAPFFVAIDLESGHVRAELPLSNLVLGQRFEERAHGEFGVSRWPALAVAPDGSRGYIAHAEDEGITVVDLERMTVARTSTPRFASNALERFGGWVASRLVSRAEAKGGLYFMPQIFVSPDGSRLYVTGAGSETCAGQPYFACVEGAPMGLRVIDADSLELVRRVDGISQIALSPDGSMVVGTAVVADGRGVEGETPYRQFAAGIVLLNLDDSEVAPRVVRPGVAYDRAGFGLDGRVYARASLPISFEHRCVDGCSLLTVLDGDGGVLADRVTSGWSALATR